MISGNHLIKDKEAMRLKDLNLPRNRREGALLPDSGRYTFSGQAAIRNEAKMSAPVLATYGAGDGVTYDRLFEADGHWWISYISYSGARRYIALA